MARWKLPPKVKIYEAYSVIADGRYVILSDNEATSTSSNGKKSYTIKWQNAYPLRMTSNDNSTYWKGNIGYPMIAILMAIGKISYRKEIADLFANINWNTLNNQNGHNYELVVEMLLNQLEGTHNLAEIREDVDHIYRQLARLNLHKLNKRCKPPQ